MLTPSVKAMLFAPTPTRPTPAKERRSRRPGLPSAGSRSATSVRSRSPARVNLIVRKGRELGDGDFDGHRVGAEEENRKEQRGLHKRRWSVLAPGHDSKSTVLAQRSPACWTLSFLRSRVRLTVWSKISLPRRDALSELLVGQGSVVRCKK